LVARTNTSGAALPVTYTLLKTKTQIPILRGAFVERPVLFERLDAGLPLTLVCAPPGSGKTALLARWAAGQGESAAWLSLDEFDNDLTRFLAYLAAAVRAADETLTAVLNALSDSPLTLVLDNFEAISNAAIHDALTFMIDHLPPGARLVVAGRTQPPLPLARHYLAGQLEHIDNLALSPDEAAALLGLPPGDELARLLTQRTGGWVAGIQFAALWRKQGEDPESFCGSCRHVYDYFMEEVIAPQPAALQNFLLHTAILGSLHAEVCNAVTGQQDGQALLERLERLKLFVIPLDDQRRAYRYLPLFADFLRAWLGKHAGEGVSLPELHLRASAAYERCGEFAQAIDHALEAEAWERATTLIERCAARGIDVSSWTARLPFDLLSSHPVLVEPLSEREAEVLEMISTGMSNPEIASKLIIAVSTVKTHVKNIYRKLDVDSRYEAMQRAREIDVNRLRMEHEYRHRIQ
jgi:LuxR family maltose regulon positive regulatory protein